MGGISGTDGNFYGTTHYGGTFSWGTVFQITPSGALTTLHSFDYADGANPAAGLVQATDGDFYGTTTGGGTTDGCYSGCGTVFRLSLGLGPFVETQPTAGKVGAAVRILGSHLTGASSVTFNGTPAVFGIWRSARTALPPNRARDGNLHPIILFDARRPGDLDKARAAGAEILEHCLSVRGSITGEDGVGMEKNESPCDRASR